MQQTAVKSMKKAVCWIDFTLNLPLESSSSKKSSVRYLQNEIDASATASQSPKTAVKLQHSLVSINFELFKTLSRFFSFIMALQNRRAMDVVVTAS